ncbi:hypothetical protein DOX47_19385 [Cronobacter malonaticus]|nr:hypothetical protein [Cronobacter malonaticus]
MKRSLYLIAFIPFLYGCTSSPTAQQQQRAMGSEEYKSKSGKVWSVNKLKEDYKGKTGMLLSAPDANSCGWDSTCYQNAWAEAYDKGIENFKSKRAAEEKVTESKCLSDPECKKSKEIIDARKGLSWGYSMILGANPYSQAEYDYLVRDICEKTTIAQKKGVSREVLANRMRDLPGVAPRDRGFLTEIVKSCWDISELSGDWKAAIRQ